MIWIIIKIIMIVIMIIITINNINNNFVEEENPPQLYCCSSWGDCHVPMYTWMEKSNRGSLSCQVTLVRGRDSNPKSLNPKSTGLMQLSTQSPPRLRNQQTTTHSEHRSQNDRAIPTVRPHITHPPSSPQVTCKKTNRLQSSTSHIQNTQRQSPFISMWDNPSLCSCPHSPISATKSPTSPSHPYSILRRKIPQLLWTHPMEQPPPQYS